MQGNLETTAQALPVRIGVTRHPVWLALALAVLSMPVITLALLLAPESSTRISIDRLNVLEAAVLAVIGTTLAAVVGGWVGGWIHARRRTLGTLFAIGLAWPVGVTSVPAAAALLAIEFEALELCISSCSPLLRSADPHSGAWAYGMSAIISNAFLVPLAVAGALFAGAFLMNRRRLVVPGAFLVVAAYAALHWVAIEGGPLVVLSFASLGVGIVLWSWLLRPERAVASRRGPLLAALVVTLLASLLAAWLVAALAPHIRG